MNKNKIKLVPMEEDYQPDIELDLTPMIAGVAAVCAGVAAFRFVWKLLNR